MKLLVPLIIALLTACSSSEIKPKQTENSFVLNNVNIVDVENQAIHHRKSIVVKNGKIASIINSDSQLPPHDISIIDGEGGYITPGLIDMHVHMYEKAAYVLTLSHGVTHVRIMNGVPKQLQWRDKIASGNLLGSTSTVSSPIISGFKGKLLQHGVETAQEAVAAVKRYHEQGYDLIKAYGSLNEETLTAITNEASRLNMPVAKHGPHASGDMHVSTLTGFQSFEHVEDIYQGPLNYEFSPEKLPSIIAELKATQVPITPTLNIFYQLTKLSQEKDDYLTKIHVEYTPDIVAFETKRNQVKRWLGSSDKMATHNQKALEFFKEITNALYEHDISLLVGSDSGVLLSPHGLATHNEMDLLKKSGLNAFDVLAAATINPARALKLENSIGKIAVSFDADFIFSKDNPIEELSILKKPKAVVKNGHWYSEEELSHMRNDAIESRSFWEELSVLMEAL